MDTLHLDPVVKCHVGGEKGNRLPTMQSTAWEARNRGIIGKSLSPRPPHRLKWNFLIGTFYALEICIQPLHRIEDRTGVCCQNAGSIYCTLKLRFTLYFSFCSPPKINKALNVLCVFVVVIIQLGNVFWHYK